MVNALNAVVNALKCCSDIYRVIFSELWSFFFEEHLRVVKVKAPGTTFLISSAFHTEWAAKMEKLTCARITFDYIEFIPKILGSQEVPCFHEHNLASNSSSISNFLNNYLVTLVLLNHPAVEPVGHVEYMFSPPGNKLH